MAENPLIKRIREISPGFGKQSYVPRSSSGGRSNKKNSAERLRQLAEDEKKKKAQAEAKAKAEAEAKRRVEEEAKLQAQRDTQAKKEEQRQQRINQSVQAYLDRTSKTFVDVGQRRNIDPRLLASASTGGRPVGMDGNKLTLGILNKNNDIQINEQTKPNTDININTMTNVANNRVSEIYSNVQVVQQPTRTEQLREEFKGQSNVLKTYAGFVSGISDSLFKPVDMFVRDIANVPKKTKENPDILLDVISDTVNIPKTSKQGREQGADVLYGTSELIAESFFPTQKEAQQRREQLKKTLLNEVKEYKADPSLYAGRKAGQILSLVIEEVVFGPSRAIKNARKVKVPTGNIIGDVDIKIVQQQSGIGTRQPVAQLPIQEQLSLLYKEKTKQGIASVLVDVSDGKTIVTKTLKDKIYSVTDLGTVQVREEFDIIGTGKKLKKTEIINIKGSGKADNIGLRFFEQEIVKDVAQQPALLDNVLFQQQEQVLKQNVELQVGKQKFSGPLLTDVISGTATRTGDFITTQLQSKTIAKDRFSAKVYETVVGKDVKPTTPVISDVLGESRERVVRQTSDLLETTTKDVIDFNLMTIGRTDIQTEILGDTVAFKTESFGLGTLQKQFNTPLLEKLNYQKLLDVPRDKKGQLAIGQDTSNIFGIPVESIQSQVKAARQFDINIMTNASKSKFNIDNVFKLGRGSATKSATDTILNTKSDISFKQDQKQTPTQDSILKSDTTQVQRQVPDTAFDSFYKTDTITIQDLDKIGRTPRIKYGIPKKVIPIRIPKDLDMPQKAKKKSSQGYVAYVKDKGKYIKASNKTYNFDGAFNVGASVVDNSASATFKVVKSNKSPQEMQGLNKLLSNKFRKTKKNINTYTEKNKNRIDTLGEVQGISAKGWIAQTMKRRMRF